MDLVMLAVILFVANSLTIGGGYAMVPLLQSVMKGVAAAVVGLLGSIIYKMAMKLITEYRSALLALGAFMALDLFKVNPIAIILGAGALGLVLYWRQ